MDTRRPGAGRRRAGRALGVLVPVVLLVVFWQPVKAVLVEVAVRGSALAGGVLGLDASASAEPSGAAAAAPAPPQGAGPEPATPTFDAAGLLVLPADFREWVFVGAAVGLSYSDDGQTMGQSSAGPGAFTHVYLEPTAYRAYRATGAFPEGATFVLDIHASATGEPIARRGWFEGGKMGTHAAVKDSARFPGGWGYFDVDRTGVGRPVRTDSCRSCHLEHGAVDNVFVQFYPLLRDVAASAGTGSGMR